MNFNNSELHLLLEGLSKLGGNEENWNLQDRLIKLHNEIELDKNDDVICHWND